LKPGALLILTHQQQNIHSFLQPKTQQICFFGNVGGLIPLNEQGVGD
jgi:hypothetical protein